MDTLRVSAKNINKLPKKVGVYLFYSSSQFLPDNGKRNRGRGNDTKLEGKKRRGKIWEDEPIYIGKAINIRIRVKNHFLQPSFRDNLFIGKVTRIGFLETASEIEALILEASLIKKHQPKFNVVWRDDKNYFYLAIAKNSQKLPYLFITHQPGKIRNPKSAGPAGTPGAPQGEGCIRNKSKIQNSKFKTRFEFRYSNFDIRYIGPFVEGNPLKKTLKYLRRVFPFYTSPRHPKNQCTWCHLGLCPGPAPDATEYKKNIKKLELILRGNSKKVLNSLKREMAVLSKEHKFEEAAKKRDKIHALEQIILHAHVIESMEQNNGWPKTQGLLQSILGTTRMISRIECFDISNIQGKNATGSMIVFSAQGGPASGWKLAPDKSQYKKFRVNMKQEPNDIAMLKEIISRRLAHPEWPYPEVMLIDGGKAQLNAAIQVKRESTMFLTAVRNMVPNRDIKIISIAKGRLELFIENRKSPIPLKNLPQEVYNVIKYLDDEAHRFAISYHKKLREQAMGLDK